MTLEVMEVDEAGDATTDRGEGVWIVNGRRRRDYCYSFVAVASGSMDLQMQHWAWRFPNGNLK